jgi:predicted peroxiredoxin
VYKESLEETIQPSFESVVKAMDYYRRQGGTTAFYVCDDGMQVIDREEVRSGASFA